MDDVDTAHLQARNLHLVVRRQHGITASASFAPGGRTYGWPAAVGGVPGDLAASPQASLAVADWKTIGGGQAGAAVGEAPRYHIAGMTDSCGRSSAINIATCRLQLADDVKATQRQETKKRRFVSRD